MVTATDTLPLESGEERSNGAGKEGERTKSLLGGADSSRKLPSLEQGLEDWELTSECDLVGE